VPQERAILFGILKPPGEQPKKFRGMMGGFEGNEVQVFFRGAEQRSRLENKKEDPTIHVGRVE